MTDGISAGKENTVWKRVKEYEWGEKVAIWNRVVRDGFGK